MSLHYLEIASILRADLATTFIYRFYILICVSLNTYIKYYIALALSIGTRYEEALKLEFFQAPVTFDVFSISHPHFITAISVQS